MDALTVIGRYGGGFRALRVSDGKVSDRAFGLSEEAALSATGHDGGPVLRLGEGTPDTVPTRADPGDGTMPCLTRDRPADLLGAWARLIVAGFAARQPHWDGVILTGEGDVSHWIHLSAGEIVSFQGFLTPRLVAALGGADAADPDALTDTMSRPERLAAHLHRATLSGDGRALTGHLIGAELASARPYWLGQQVVLVPPDSAGLPYGAALAAQGVPVEVGRADMLMTAGLGMLQAV